MQDLPVIQPQAAERADAARNRERILCAARRLFDEKGARCVSMDEIADAAGVGKGTLFRRFGSRAALAHAVLSEDEARLQEGFIRGAPPLGPGAPARERLIAFGEARLDLIAAHSELLAAAEAAGPNLDSPPYAASRLHVELLLRELDPGCDSELLSDTLLAGLTAGLFLYLRGVRGFDLARIKEGWRRQVEGLVPADAADAAEPALS
ncbi:MAG TPA: helix-turn-helix domain-containing protein [Solirubrobacteraceae bacterium]|jgi:AcrR family transcriptional regulator|nr:helix-turn-helix domain-containing protein [Solirubrobacteraceae bacterium]